MQVISNLITNALKFTPSGGDVAVRFSYERGMVKVSVEDTGPGIPEEAIPSLFQRYARVGRAINQVEGTGLGLMIVREIVEAHGGTVGVDSEEGAGSIFWFRLPARESTRSRTPQNLVVPESRSGERAESVLVVDDDEDIRQTLASLLEAEGYHANLAVDGADALRLLADGPLPDLILLDLAMPRVDGREFRIRQRRDPRIAHIPVIVISAERGMATDPSLGGSHFLRKPVDFALVRQAIKRVLAEGARRSSPPPQEVPLVAPDAG